MSSLAVSSNPDSQGPFLPAFTESSFLLRTGLPQHRFLASQTGGRKCYPKEALGPDSITVTQGDLYPTPCSGPPSVARTHDSQCRRSAGAMLSGLRPHRVGGTLLWSSMGPMWRPSLEEGEENREKGPEAQSSVSAATSKCGS